MTALSCVGRELGINVARRLKQGRSLAYHHPYYCGTGLTHVEDIYIRCQVGDWGWPTKAKALEMPARNEHECLTFESEASFVTWLAQQTDESLMGPNRDTNQRVTISRLKEFARAGSLRQSLAGRLRPSCLPRIARPQ